MKQISDCNHCSAAAVSLGIMWAHAPTLSSLTSLSTDLSSEEMIFVTALCLSRADGWVSDLKNVPVTIGNLVGK
jgi:hypothetical protein